MTCFNKQLHRALFLSSTVILLASNAHAQAGDASTGEGLFSYIFSFRAVTVVLVMMLIAQIVYRQRQRNTQKPEAVQYKQHVPQQRKKRYDSAQMSSLLKASASGAANPVLLAQSHEHAAPEQPEPEDENPAPSETEPSTAASLNTAESDAAQSLI